MKLPVDFERIANYLEGDLTAEDKRSFEEQLDIDPYLREQVEQVRIALKGVENTGLKNDLKNIHDELYNPSRDYRATIWRWVAVLVLLVPAVWFVVSNLNQPDLFTAYFKPYPNVLTARATDNNTLTSTMSDYSSGKYTSALSGFAELKEMGIDSDEIDLYMGITYLQLDKTAEAIQLWSDLGSQHRYAPQIKWYLALAYLKSEQTDQAKKLLMALEQNNFNYQQAQEILQRL